MIETKKEIITRLRYLISDVTFTGWDHTDSDNWENMKDSLYTVLEYVKVSESFAKNEGENDGI